MEPYGTIWSHMASWTWGFLGPPGASWGGLIPWDNDLLHTCCGVYDNHNKELLDCLGLCVAKWHDDADLSLVRLLRPTMPAAGTCLTHVLCFFPMQAPRRKSLGLSQEIEDYPAQRSNRPKPTTSHSDCTYVHYRIMLGQALRFPYQSRKAQPPPNVASQRRRHR